MLPDDHPRRRGDRCRVGDRVLAVGSPGVPGPGAWPDRRVGEAEHYRFHFPDGNASVARLLVRALVPATVPGHTVETSSRRERNTAGSTTRVPRFGSASQCAVRARHTDSGEREVECVCARRAVVVGARGACVLACWNSVIPGICPGCGDAADALRYGIKVPLVYTNVALRRWSS